MAGILLFFLGPGMMLKFSWVAYIFSVSGILMTLYFGMQLRRQNGGYFTYGQAFHNLMTLSAIEIGVNMFIMVLLYQVIAPDFAEAVAEELSRQATGFAEDQVSATMASMSVLVYSNPSSMIGTLVGGVLSLFGAIMLNSILSMILREEPSRYS